VWAVLCAAVRVARACAAHDYGGSSALCRMRRVARRVARCALRAAARLGASQRVAWRMLRRTNTHSHSSTTTSHSCRRLSACWAGAACAAKRRSDGTTSATAEHRAMPAPLGCLRCAADARSIAPAEAEAEGKKAAAVGADIGGMRIYPHPVCTAPFGTVRRNGAAALNRECGAHARVQARARSTLATHGTRSVAEAHTDRSV